MHGIDFRDIRERGGNRPDAAGPSVGVLHHVTEAAPVTARPSRHPRAASLVEQPVTRQATRPWLGTMHLIVSKSHPFFQPKCPSPASFESFGTRPGPLSNTLVSSSFVPLACPYECETARNSMVQRERKGSQIPAFEQGVRPFAIVSQPFRREARSDLKSVRSPVQRRSRPPESPSTDSFRLAVCLGVELSRPPRALTKRIRVPISERRTSLNSPGRSRAT